MKINHNTIYNYIAASIITLFTLSVCAEAPKAHVTEKIFGHNITDPYRWMENGDDYQLSQWIRSQNSKTEQYLAGDLKQQILSELTSPQLAINQKLDAETLKLKTYYEQHLKQKHDRLPRVYRHPAVLESRSPNEQYQVSFSSNNGGDLKTLKIHDIAQNSYLPDTLFVKFVSLTWSPDGDYLIYSTDRDHRNGGTLSAVFAHKIGEATNLKDKLIWEANNPFQYASIATFDKSDYLLIQDDSNQVTMLYALDIENQELGDKLWSYQGDVNSVVSEGSSLYFTSYKNESNGEIIRLDLTTMIDEVFIPAQARAIDSLSIWNGQFFIHYLKPDITHDVVHFNPETQKFKSVTLPFSGIYGFYPSQYGAYGYAGSYSIPWVTLIYNEEKMAFELTDYAQTVVDNVNIDAKPIYYHLPSGHQSVIWLITKKGVKVTRKTPLYLYGYGGFRVNILPNNGMATRNMPLLNRDGAIAVVTLPGGLEQGEDWHKLGSLLNKKNVFRAMALAARKLQREGISSRNHMAIGGGSNGGLLVAATINRYPRLFKAAIPEVGVLDSLRYHKHTGGKWWVSEYGDPSNKKHFNYLKSYSPYHNIKNRNYPSILVMTSDGDDRVVPAHSYKYTAKLQDKLGHNDDEHSVVLLHTQKFGSHGGSIDANEYYNAQANKLTFLIKELK
ncbi:prolyl oligopeptidase family serine peptidase [Aliikangiella sp. IMCC44359]|uniref:prolyl oligopeptidase family serine peptidase n=1 Tax=Aliikangiella sp. IMCC44359 TaxID=3459125 RepID=UPI00403ACB21